MAKRLTDFLIKLSTDSHSLEQFETDPAGTMDAAGLSATERKAVLSRNPNALRKELGQPHVSHMTDEKKKTAKKKKKTAKKKAAKKK